MSKCSLIKTGALLCLVLALVTTACTPNLGGDNLGWAPVSASFAQALGESTKVYVVSPLSGDLDDLGNLTGQDLGDDERQVKIRALEDFGSGSPRVVWTYPPLGSGTGLVGAFGPPAVSEELGLVFVGGVDGHIYALNSETGEESTGWQRAVRNDPSVEPQPVIGAPVLAELINSETGPTAILLVVSEDGNLYAFNAGTGEELPWSPFRTGDKIWSTPLVQNGIAYFGSQDHFVYAVDLRDGRQVWRYETGGAVVSSPLLFAGKLFIGSFDRRLYALDADDGELEWAFESQNWFWAGPVTDGETVFAPSMDGYVYALSPQNPPSGEPKEALWRHYMEGPIVSTPVLVPLGLVVAAVDGRMRLLSTSPSNLMDGEVISNLPSLDEGEIKAPLIAGAPPNPSLGTEPDSLSVIQRYSVFVAGDNGVVRRISVTEGQDKESIWCFDSSIHRQCN
ncbi:MAG: PQQ-binding-like beta-propeller repeat protein [Chloroflexota bacterium]|nr:PQQ-binding-like beta-propeller repeat protein [Chloroflexota bacterium]